MTTEAHAQPGIARRLAEWGAGRREMPEIALARATDAIVDTLGCMVAGANDPATRAVRAALATGCDGAAPLIGGGGASASVAGVVNGTAAHALDFDDNFRPGRSHASAVLVPALAALAPDGVSGEGFLAAYLTGLEAMAVIGRGFGGTDYYIGWHSTSTTGCVGTAVGLAHLLGFDADRSLAAISNATSLAAGMKRQFGTAMKPIHAGLAARGAIDAVLLARAGVAGDPAALDGPQGMLALYGTGDAPGWDHAPIAAPLAIESEGLAPKRFPCCGSTHWVLDMVYDLKAMHGFVAGQVAEVVAHVGPANLRNLPFARPDDGKQARFSMHYCVAVALRQDMLGLEDFEDGAVMRPEIRALLGVTTMNAYSFEEELAAGGRLPHRLRVTLHDGRTFTAERQEVKGTIRDPFTTDEKRAKFASCLAFGGARDADADGLFTRLLGLAEARDISVVREILGLGLVPSG